MLLISRNIGQSIIIADDIRIIYCGMNQYRQARFGIEAPIDIKIYREEIYERVRDEEIKTAGKRVMERFAGALKGLAER